MNSRSALYCMTLALAAALALSACRKDGADPALGMPNAGTTAVPGSGAGNSATGATGGTATSPGAGGTQNPVAATPGTSGDTGGMQPGAAAVPTPAGTSQPGQAPSTTPSR